jgi:hypothetical protein
MEITDTENMESQQKNHYHRHIKYVDQNGVEKKERVLIYSSGDPGSKIRNAITGAYYPNYIVGSKDEYMLYKVRLVKDGKPLIFFFDSPQQYEESQHITVSDIKKEEWYERKVKRFEK